MFTLGAFPPRYSKGSGGDAVMVDAMISARLLSRTGRKSLCILVALRVAQGFR